MGFFKSTIKTKPNSFQINDSRNNCNLLPDQGGVVMMMSDDLESFLSKENSENRSSTNRSRLSSNGDSTLSSMNDVSSYTVPPILDTITNKSPKKISLHRRNRHVLASSSCSSSQSSSSSSSPSPTKKRAMKKKEKSIRRRRRNRAWNEMDFESMGFAFLSSK
jgi:hypothetical protein